MRIATRAGWKHLAAGAGVGCLLSLPYAAAALVLSAVGLGATFWLPLAAIPSLIFIARRGLARAACAIVLGTLMVFIPAAYFQWSSSTELSGLLSVAAWSSLWFTVLISPLIFRLLERTRSAAA